ncbi:MAG: DUF6088 family protein [Anaerovoracaceae bacterium]|nr:DUF6088 family protein [Anaerovoracaceae bacterium]
MEFFDYLVRVYGYNEVILSNEIYYDGYSVSWIKKMLKKLCDEEKIIRFEKGVYYIPTDTPLGKSRLDPKKVIIKKYINDGNKIIGYFSGMTFMNMLGLSAQMPNMMEIYTNNEPSRVREVPVGSQRVLLRRSRTVINSSNAATLSFLELMNFTDAGFYDAEKKKIVAAFIDKNGITRKSVSIYSPYFPDKAMRTLVESEVIYDVTR